MTQPRRFRLIRDHDVTGASGTGHVANGVRWPDSTATVRWRGSRASTVHWESINDAIAIHGHGGATRIEWIDPEPIDWWNADLNCPHCPDGHTPPTGGSQPWGAFISSDRDADGQPVQIIVMRSAGAHVAESDAEWVRRVLNGRAD
jgi:hypothetical protein